jgi:hypothetical protein
LLNKPCKLKIIKLVAETSGNEKALSTIENEYPSVHAKKMLDLILHSDDCELTPEMETQMVLQC